MLITIVGTPKQSAIIPAGVKYPITFLISRMAGKLSHMAVPNAFIIPQKACHRTVTISIKIFNFPP